MRPEPKERSDCVSASSSINGGNHRSRKSCYMACLSKPLLRLGTKVELLSRLGENPYDSDNRENALDWGPKLALNARLG
jgi:hypothetical protein